jgi:hypothetical protein
MADAVFLDTHIPFFFNSDLAIYSVESLTSQSGRTYTESLSFEIPTKY